MDSSNTTASTSILTHLNPKSGPSESKLSNQHLSYPTPSARPSTPPPTASSSHQPRQLLKDRLYVGNLHPTVDEYTLLQIFSKFGKVTKLDFLFHKTGLMKGKPRGYAFVEYENKDDALKALGTAHDKLLRGRKLVVTFAHQAPLDQAITGPSAYGSAGKHRKNVTEAGKPTTLSMLKSAMGGRHDATKDKIALMEAKLRQMESTKPKPPTTDTSSSSSSTTPTPYHPSLPLKPPIPIPSSLTNHSRSPSNPKMSARATSRSNTPLPSLPILPQSRSSTESRTANLNSLPLLSRLYAHPQIESSKSLGLAGVRIVKAKEK